jgi:hypothetical protein
VWLRRELKRRRECLVPDKADETYSQLTSLFLFRSLDRIFGAYTTGAPFSVDLVVSALRQCELIGKLDQLGWLSKGKFKKDDTLLYLAAARYTG